VEGIKAILNYNLILTIWQLSRVAVKMLLRHVQSKEEKEIIVMRRPLVATMNFTARCLRYGEKKNTIMNGCMFIVSESLKTLLCTKEHVQF